MDDKLTNCRDCGKLVKVAKNRSVHTVICDGCKEKYMNHVCNRCKKPFRKYVVKSKLNRPQYCNKCKRKIKNNYKKQKKLKHFSIRVIKRIIKIELIPCSICGWNESTCDIHHIDKQGLDNAENLIIICPNCHRTVHTTKKYSIDFLQQHSIAKLFSQYQFYKKIDMHRKSPIININEKYANEKITKVRNSNIDFGKFGWVKKVSSILDIRPQKVHKWMIRYMLDFYRQHCFKTKVSL